MTVSKLVLRYSNLLAGFEVTRLLFPVVQELSILVYLNFRIFACGNYLGFIGDEGAVFGNALN